MPLTTTQIILTILAITIGTMLTRFTPFILFPESKEPPHFIEYLGNILPPAMMGLLVIYCLKNISFADNALWMPKMISIGVIIVLHKWKNNVLLSILGGTICYMVCVQFLF